MMSMNRASRIAECGLGNRRAARPIAYSRSAPAAFTLFELLLALGMMAMLALTLSMAMSVGMKSRARAIAVVDNARSAAIATELLRQDLESVLPPTGILAGAFIGTRQGDAGGEADNLEFYTIGANPGDAAADSPLAEGIRRIELAVRTDVTPAELVRRTTVNLLAPAEREPAEEILCRGVRTFTLRYFDGALWQDQWDSTALGNVLPAAVEMTLELDTPEGKDARPYKIVRIIPLACATPAEGLSGTGGGQ